MNILKLLFGAIKSVFDFLTHRSKLNNAPAVVGAKKNQQESDKVNETNNAIENRDIDKIRKELGQR